MPLIKLMTVDSHNCYCGGDYDDTTYRLGQDITDWEEVTDEELMFLKKYKHELWMTMRKENPRWDYNHNLVIVELDVKPVKERITNLRDKLKEQIEAEKQAALKRAAQAEELQRQKLLQKAAQDKKTYEALKVKFGG